MTKPLSERERFALLQRETVYQALRDLILPSEATDQERDEARIWLFADDKGEGSFLWACSVSGLDPEAVRAEVTNREVK